jgi:hypothetical protein
MTQGNAIYAEIPNDLVQEKSPLFQVNQVYNIKRFRVTPAKSFYRPIDGPTMIYITPYTIVELCHKPKSTFPEYVYRITSFNDVDPYGPKAKDFHGMCEILYILIIFFSIVSLTY